MGRSLEWVPMESNPEAINSFLRKVGIKSHITAVDVYGFDEELLRMVEGKVEGLLLCYAISDDPAGQVDETAKDKLYFMRQTIRNACATMAILHLIANRCKGEDFEPNSSLREFIESSKQLEPEKKANKFETCDNIATAHESASEQGQTEAPAASESVEYHFISIINHEGTLYEMDGRKHGPVKHGQTSEETFLLDAIGVVKKFVNLEQPVANFSVQAITRV